MAFTEEEVAKRIEAVGRVHTEKPVVVERVGAVNESGRMPVYTCEWYAKDPEGSPWHVPGAEEFVLRLKSGIGQLDETGRRLAERSHAQNVTDFPDLGEHGYEDRGFDGKSLTFYGHNQTRHMSLECESDPDKVIFRHDDTCREFAKMAARRLSDD